MLGNVYEIYCAGGVKQGHKEKEESSSAKLDIDSTGMLLAIKKHTSIAV